uniref:Choline/ethanolamine kinase n=1 Tax=Heterorhabditis bacteriophora TaxID=37862 RepID=A0A1I7X8X7_HETBA
MISNILLPKASSGNIRLPSLSDESSGCGNSLAAFNPADPRLVLIDFEYASYNYRGFDFANHFVEYSIDYDVDEPPYYEINTETFPNHEQMIQFFVNYLRELGGISENQLYNKAEDLIKVMTQNLPYRKKQNCNKLLCIKFCNISKRLSLQETLPFVPVSHFFWGVWGLLQVELSPVGFGFAEYGRDRLGLYFQNRHLLNIFSDES